MAKELSNYFSVSALILLVAYIIFNESRKNPDAEERYPTMEDINVVSQIVKYTVPDNLTFAGERVPLEEPDVKERLEREIQINTYWHNHSLTIIKRANRWLPQIEKVLKENGIPDDFKYIPVIESDLENVISSASAVGFWQFLRPTAREFGLEVSREVDERYHPIKATEAACRYLNKSYDKFKNWTLVAAAYNRGRSGIGRTLSAQNEDSYYDLQLNEETSRYVFRILAARELLTRPETYGFDLRPEELYQIEEVREVTVTETIPDLVKFSQDQGISYKLLKRHNPWLRSDRLTVRPGKEYVIAIPVNGGV